MKPNCGLCLEARTRLEKIAQRVSSKNTSHKYQKFSHIFFALQVPFEIQEIDISKPENKKFHDMFLFDTPLGYIGDREIFRHKVDEQEVEAMLRKTIDVEPIEVKPLKTKNKDN
jgi:hypothetical protein